MPHTGTGETEMLHSRRDGRRERGHILVLFELVLIVILGFAALVIDLGVLRNNRQILVNTFDAAALAGGYELPVTGSANAATANAHIAQIIQADYPSLPTSAYTITYKCLVGADTTGPLISRDIPSTCDPRISLGVPVNTPLTASDITALTSHFTGAGPTRVSTCDPKVGDKCNVVVITGSATTQYALAPVLGVVSGSTGTVVSAVCKGPCGQATVVPVDLVVIIDRTASMSAADVAATRTAAGAVLSVYNPAIQRVAFGLLGPSSANSTCSGTGGPAVHANTLIPSTLTAPSYASDTSAVASTATATLGISRPSGTASGNLLVAGITVGGGSGTTVTAPSGWTLVRPRTDGTNVSLLTYYKVAGSSEPATYSWNLSPSVRASGGIIRYTGVNTASPINTSNSLTGSDTTSPYRVTTPSVTTTTNQTALVGFYGIGAAATYTASSGLTEQFDANNTNAAGPSTEGATGTQATAATTSSTNYATATAGGYWVSQLIALNPTPVDTYGTTLPTDLLRWIPVGFTGTDTDPLHPPAYNEAYVTGSPATLNNASHIVSAINCFDNPGGTGTNLTTPIAMAAYDLQNYGRPNVTWGILLETDGQPNYSSTGDPGNYTCASADAAATAAKATTNAKGVPIQIFTVGFGLDGSNDVACPDTSGTFHNVKATGLLARMATQPSVDGGCPGTSNTDNDHFFCQPKTSDLTSIFSAIAYQFAHTGAHLVQLCPAPVVSSVTTPWTSGATVTITGSNFLGTMGVKLAGVSASSYSVLSNTSMTAVAAAAGSGGATVTTPCGTN